jgi:hypothetical protein
MQYLLLIHGNARSAPTHEEWTAFFARANASGMFRGGSQIGERFVLGDAAAPASSDHIAGYMRFDTDDREALVELLKTHPVVVHGGTIELCKMTES